MSIQNIKNIPLIKATSHQIGEIYAKAGAVVGEKIGTNEAKKLFNAEVLKDEFIRNFEKSELADKTGQLTKSGEAYLKNIIAPELGISQDATLGEYFKAVANDGLKRVKGILPVKKHPNLLLPEGSLLNVIISK